MIYGDFIINNPQKSLPLNENTICKENNFLITIDFSYTETNFKFDPYVKVYPAKNYTSTDEVARIHFLSNYRYEKIHSGKKAITFNNNDLKTVCNLLKLHWSKLISIFIKGCNIIGERKEELLNTPYPEDLYNIIKK